MFHCGVIFYAFFKYDFSLCFLSVDIVFVFCGVPKVASGPKPTTVWSKPVFLCMGRTKICAGYAPFYCGELAFWALGS